MGVKFYLKMISKDKIVLNSDFSLFSNYSLLEPAWAQFGEKKFSIR